MNDLQEITRNYQRAKRQIETERVLLKEKIQQQIENQSIKALKIQNQKVSQIHKNQHLIEVRLKRNNEKKGEMEDQLGVWVKMYEELNRSLKKAGDLAHYANFIEDEVEKVCFEINPSNKGQEYKSRMQNFE